MFDELAYQVDETACRRFETDWLSDRRRPIEDYLPAETSSCFLATLEELVHIELELAWKCVAGAATSSPESLPTADAPPCIEAFLERFPQLRDEAILFRLVRQEYAVRRRSGAAPRLEEYRRRFPHLTLSEEAFDTRRLSHIEEPTFGAGQLPSAKREADLLALGVQSFGNYELLEPLGRGGMGMVYRARQRGAERDVALKVIGLRCLDGLSPERRRSVAERFRTEAIAAARIEHENIVAVYDVGEVEGRQFYAMRLVEGVSLAAMTQWGPLDNRRAAAYLEAVARAVHAAHERGILHRDLKPQNILVDAQTDRPLVADFGLAKFMTGAETLTRSGELVGTPAYMAPEQIDDASRAGRDSDIYSLGATLYHLLSGRPPFQAAALTDTLWQVRNEEPVAPRRLNPAVAPDLDTICLKCLQKERSRRYESAESLADDLRRHLNGEPILARPLGPVERMLRWRRRNPIAARWLLAAAAMFLATLGVGAAGYLSTAQALARDRQSFQQARQAVEDLHIAVSEDDLLNQPGMQPLRQKLLQRALSYYQKFLDERSGDRTVARDLAAASYQVGRITEELESPEAALPHYHRARQAQERLVAANSEDPALWEALGDTLNALGAALRKLERHDESIAAFEQAAGLRERLIALDGEQAPWRRKLANIYMNLGIVEAARGDLPAARRQAAKADALRQRLREQDPDDDRVLNDCGKGHYNLAKIALAESRFHEAKTELQAAIELFLVCREKRPENLDSRSQLAVCYRLLGQVLSGAGGAAEASSDAYAAYQQARDAIEELARENPRVGAYQAELAAVYLELAWLDNSQRRFEQARQALQAAEQLLAPLASQEARWRRDLAVTLREMALLDVAQEQLAAAQAPLARSLREWQGLVSEFPDNADYQAELQQTERTIAALKERLGQN